MFKTIFSRLIIVFVFILLLGFSITGFMLNYFLNNFLSAEKNRTLNESGWRLSSFISENIENINNPFLLSILRSSIKGNEEYTRSMIWIVDKDGYIAITNHEDMTQSIRPAILQKMKVGNSGKIRLPNKAQYEKVMLGTEETVKEVGDFYGLFSQNIWLTIEKPIRIKEGSGNVVTVGAVYLHTTISEVQRAKNQVFKFFFIAVGVSIFISIILVYIFSLKISRPLKQIKLAAKQIAGGEFQKRLNIKTKDEIGELAMSFNHMAMALQNLEEMRRGFIANVSHELRTPMTSIRGFVEGILDGTIPPEKQENYLTIVREETIRLSRLVTDLLDLARMEAGEMTLNYKTFDIAELIRRSIITLESFITKKHIRIEAHFESENMLAFADMDAIERVILNLIHNGVKFSHENGLIKISATNFKDRILVTVEDQGIGIRKDEMNLIWDRFYKSDQSRGKDKTGTGLGLSIIKNIINEHKQEIWVESELEMGTKFMFTIERAQ